MKIKLFQKKLHFFFQSKTDPIHYQFLQHWPMNPVNLENAIKFFYGAAYYDQISFVQEGICANLPIHVINANGFSLLTSAAWGGALRTLDYLLNQLRINPILVNQRYNALHAACLGGKFTAIQFLLLHASQYFHINMPEPIHAQSPLQTAISENQFACAIQMIKEFDINLFQPDRHRRTALATAFCCFVNAAFDRLRNNPEKTQQLEELCYLLLMQENAFAPISSMANPAYLMLHTCELALDLPSGTQLQNRIDANRLVTTLMVYAPKVAVLLLLQAQANPGGILESHYIALYTRCELDVRDETKQVLCSLILR